jgi:DNA primase
MRFPPSLLDEIRARLPVSQVVARKVALKRKGAEFAGLSPFKVEKTPSFFVNDRKGFYHCFSSGEHGDIFTFLMKTEGISFPEAVERLANEAGVTLPKPEHRNEQKEDERTRLLALLAASERFFVDQLRSAGGAEARAYLEKRGLRRDTLEQFGIGYAPPGRAALKEHLARQGFSVEDMVLSGMAIGGADIPLPYDRFRHRVMFPIADLRGRVIAFGGRALDPGQPAKYLNSPETPLFHKGSILFNAARARGFAHKAQRLIVVEGYMDAIALAEAGFGECVAPLGTALTSDQVELLWKLAPEATLCFDGDSAGRKAAYRAVEVVLPKLQPGRTASFLFLPDGLDPDDLVRQQGPEAFRDLIEHRRRPLFDVLVEREELSVGAMGTPDARAALETRLKGLIATIGDGAVRAHYDQELRSVLFERGRKEMRARATARGRPAAPGPVLHRRNNTTPDWRLRERARIGGSGRPGPVAPPRNLPSNELTSRAHTLPAREALLVATLCSHPWLLEQHAEEIADMELTAPQLVKVRDALLSLLSDTISLDSAAVRSQLERSNLHKVLGQAERTLAHKSDRFALRDADRTTVEVGWRHTLTLHNRQVGLQRALAAAERSWREEQSESALARILEIQRLLSSSDNLEFPAET